MLAVRLAAAGGLGPLEAKLRDATRSDPASFLAVSAHSTRVLERAGGVTTSAGMILAGTFLGLRLLPLEQRFQLGFAVALGVLVDTFVVRTLRVAALAFRLGRISWWPWRLDRL